MSRRLYVFRVPILLVCAALLAGGCSSDSTSPVEPGPRPDATATVDAGGGELAHGGVFSLVVPAGALPDETTLELYVDEAPPVAAIAAADVYRIEGLPADFAAPLTCRLQVPAGADSLVGLIGAEVYVTSLQETRVTWEATACTDSLDWVIFALPAATAGAGKADAAPPVRLSAAQSITLDVTPSGRFRIAWSPVLTTEDRITRLGADLDDALEFYDTLGFVQTGFTHWPVNALIMPLADSYGYWSPAPWRLGGHLVFDAGILASAEETRATAAHETFHFCQYFYDPRPILARALVENPGIWLDEATAVWMEGLFTDDPDYCSAARRGRELTPLDGIVTPRGVNDLAKHGYGLSSLIKYLALDEDADFVKDVYDDIAAGQHPVAALEAAVETTLPDVWREFCEMLVSGQLYVDVTLDELLAYPTVPLLVASGAADTSGTVGLAYPDLSGQPFPVTWSDGYVFPADSYLRVWCEGGATGVSVYGCKAPATRQLLGHAYGPVILANLPNLQNAYDRLVVLVSHHRLTPPSYDATSELWVQARVRRPSIAEYGYDHGKILIRYEAFWSSGLHALYQDMTYVEVPGTYNGTTFSAAWDSVDNSAIHYVGHVNATFDPADMHVLSWSAQNNAEWAEGSRIFQASGTSLPDVSANPTSYTGSQEGEAVCAGIDQLYAAYLNADGEPTNELTSYTCNTGSYVKVLLYDRSR